MIGGAAAGALLAVLILALGITTTAWVALAIAALVLALDVADNVRRH